MVVLATLALAVLAAAIVAARFGGEVSYVESLAHCTSSIAEPPEGVEPISTRIQTGASSTGISGSREGESRGVVRNRTGACESHEELPEGSEA